MEKIDCNPNISQISGTQNVAQATNSGKATSNEPIEKKTSENDPEKGLGLDDFIEGAKNALDQDSKSEAANKQAKQ